LATGILFGSTPLLGFKTLLSLLFAAWLRGNKIAAVVGASLHDLTLPLLPVLLRVEYDIGFWLLSQPHHLPMALHHLHLRPHEWLSWTTFFTVGAPLLLGWLVIGLPLRCLVYFARRRVLKRRPSRSTPT
jgi:uncharacterized protein